MGDVVGQVVASVQGLITGFLQALPRIGLAAGVFILFLVASGRVRDVVRNVIERTGRPQNVGVVLGRLARWGTIAAGIVVALSLAAPGFGVGQLVQLVGIGSVAIAFAFRDVLQNSLAGLLILVQQPFELGDQIEVSGYEGTVENIETRATDLRTFDGRKVMIPNSEIYTSPVTVNTAYDTRRSQYEFRIGYPEDIGQAREVIPDAIRAVEGVLEEPEPDVRVVDLGDSGVVIRGRWWTRSEQSNAVAVQDEVVKQVKERLEAEGIDIPYTTRTVHLHQENGGE